MEALLLGGEVTSHVVATGDEPRRIDPKVADNAGQSIRQHARPFGGRSAVEKRRKIQLADAKADRCLGHAIAISPGD